MISPGITELIRLWGQGDRDAADRLFPMVYDELRRIAERYFRAEGPGHTLQPTALVHDLYIKLTRQDTQFRDRRHFYAVAARQMRHLLIDHARAANAAKRGGALARVELLQDPAGPAGAGFEALALHEALEALEKLDARVAAAVELRYFAGLTEKEAAEALDVSVATFKRDWVFAQAWLRARLRPDLDSTGSEQRPSRNGKNFARQLYSPLNQ